MSFALFCVGYHNMLMGRQKSLAISHSPATAAHQSMVSVTRRPARLSVRRLLFYPAAFQ
jgi:hypothetical protein